MKPDDFLKFAEQITRDIVVFYLEFLGLKKKGNKEEFDNFFDISNGKLWTIVIASSFLTQLFIRASWFKPVNEFTFDPTSTGTYIWKIILFSFIVHAYCLILTKTATFAETLAMCLVGFAVSSVTASIINFTFLLVFFPPYETYNRENLTTIWYVLIRALIAAAYVPKQIRYKYDLSLLKRLSISLMIIALFIPIDVYFTPNLRKAITYILF